MKLRRGGAECAEMANMSAVCAFLDIHVQPGARRTEVAGMHGDRIKIRVAAPALEGAANEELIRFVAQRLGMGLSAVSIASGERSRSKRLRVVGMAHREAVNRLVRPTRWRP